MAKHAPLRRCVGCGRVTQKSELVRLALARSETEQRHIVLDPAQSMPGRGAYLCRQPSADLPGKGCLKLARARGGLTRTLRVSVPISPELVESVER